MESKAKTKTIYRRDISRLVASDLEDALETKDWSPLYNIYDPNEAVEILLNNVTEALDTVAPEKAIKIRPDKPKISLRRDTLATMAFRDEARKAGNHECFKRLRNTATKLVKRDKIQGVLRRLKKNPGPQSVWQEAKSVLGHGRGTNLPECTTNTSPNNTAEHQNEFFVNKIARLVDSIPKLSANVKEVPKVSGGISGEISGEISGGPPSLSATETASDKKNLMSNPDAMGNEKTFNFSFVTPGSVTKIIRRLKNTKALGVDKIQTEVWKKGVAVLAGPIARICNISLSTGIFPDIFKQAIIHPVFKENGKNPRDPGSYRPISILSSLSKILEIAVRDALLDWLMLKGFIPDTQFGFLPGRSVTTALACAQNDWIEAKSSGDVVGIMAFDLSAAFDTIASATLLTKLESAGISGIPLKWFSSYMSGRSQKVLWNDSISGPRSLSHGVPQGSILGPTLFLVMVADMPKYVTDNVPNARMAAYADDSTFYLHAKNLNLLKSYLEKLASQMISYCHSAGLVLNHDKTQLLVSTNQKCQIEVGSSLISATPEINLLGVDFDSNFSTIPYLRKLARAASTRAALIYRLSFAMPPHVLATFTNGLLMGKILASCPATIPIRINIDDRYCIGVTEEINKAIKAAARTITKTKLSDKVRSVDVLEKAHLKCLNEAVASIMAVTVWKSKQSMDPLGRCLFQDRSTIRTTRSVTSNKIHPPVPGYPTLASNLMARVWNNVPELQNASTLAAARRISRKWAKEIPR